MKTPVSSKVFVEAKAWEQATTQEANLTLAGGINHSSERVLSWFSVPTLLGKTL